jgi:hypothetical protein
MRFKDKRILTIKTPEDMLRILEEKGNPESSYKKGVTIHVYNKMQQGYSFVLAEDPGKGFPPDFRPFYTPRQLLEAGVFEGKYFNQNILQYPMEWFMTALKKGKLSPQGANPLINRFKVKSRISLQQWRDSGWVQNPDHIVSSRYPILSSPQNPDRRGWAEWYFNYFLGRRIPELDTVQIKRWKAFTRHAGQIKANCRKGDVTCRPVQRQALLQWAHDPMI